jgi:adenine-specific DNA-methyltransferase
VAKKYIPFTPETIDGQAVLNFNRILKYHGNDMRPIIEKGMPYYELEKIETVGKENSENLVIHGECVSACAYLKEKGISVDLVYIDPPFASGADYAKKVYIRRNPNLAEKIAKAKEELDIDELRAFEEKMYGDVWDKEKYLNWMYENLMAIKSVMNETASIYVHLDWHIGHYVKILMDEIFGEDNFRNEIIWQKLQAAKKQATEFGNVHDTIFYYSMLQTEYTHNKQYKPHSDIRIKKHYNNRDGNNRAFSLDSFTQSGQGVARNFGIYGLLEPPSGKHWIWTQERIDEGLKNGSIIFTSKGKPRLKRYLDMSAGVAVGDIWADIFPVNSQAEEDADYSTQKPENLLERIIKASSDDGMIIADFFGGSGVTAAVANKWKRHFIHCDIGINSIQTTRDRLLTDKASFDVLKIKDGVSLYRNPTQTMDKIKSLIKGLKNEDGLDTFWEGAISDSKLGTVPVYVPNLKDSNTKILDKNLMNEIIHKALPDLQPGIKKIIVYYIDITSEEEIKKFIKEDDSTTVDIELRDLKEILDEIIVDDYVEFTVSTNYIEIKKFASDRVSQRITEFNQKAFASGKQDITISEDGLELIEYISLDCTKKNDKIWQSDFEVKINKLGYVIKNGVKTKEFWDGKIYFEKKPLRMKIRNICGDETVYDVK